MILFLDTSILVPAFVTDHQHHSVCRKLLRQCTPQTAMCAGHSLAELYSTLTRLPAPNRVSPKQALQCVRDVSEHVGFIGLTPDEYRSALEHAGAIGIAGGTIYDFLIARCTLQAVADVIYTFNTKHYQQFGAEVLQKLKTPQAESLPG